MLVVLEHHVDPLADVHGDGDLGPLVQELEALVLLGRDVDGRRDFLSRHVTPALRSSHRPPNANSTAPEPPRATDKALP